MLRDCRQITFVKLNGFCPLSKPPPSPLPPAPLSLAHISLPIATNGKLSAAIGEFPTVIGKLMIGKTLATNGEKITNAMIGNDKLANY